QHGDQFTLNGNNSHDADGDSLSYVWEQMSGEPVTLRDATSTRISVNTQSLSNTEQTLVFRLTVSDGEANDSDTVSVHMSPIESGGGNP
ncbi:PKD domain-containing protein, partial [Vibrio aestuarianus]